MVQWVDQNSPRQIDIATARRYVDIVVRYADIRKLDPMLILAVMRHESGFNANARSPYGAQGLMQVVPRWHRDKIKGRSLNNPEVAIEVGTLVLQDCFDKFNGHTFKALKCYLGGNPDKYYKNIQATHVAMGRTVVQGWFVAEEPIRDLPRMSMTSVAVPNYPTGKPNVYAVAYAPLPAFKQPTAEDRLALDRLALTASLSPGRLQ